MNCHKVKSFTLSELIVVMIITVIIIGIAFTVLNLVKKEIRVIEKNYSETTELLLFEQKLWQDFNQYSQITYSNNENKLYLTSDLDTVVYTFSKSSILRDKDTVKSNLVVNKLFFQGEEVENGQIDALGMVSPQEMPNYNIFVFKKNDATFFMNKDGF